MKWLDVLFLPYLILPFFQLSDNQAYCIICIPFFIQLILLKSQIDKIRKTIICLFCICFFAFSFIIFLPKGILNIKALGLVIFILCISFLSYFFAIFLYLYSFILKPIYLKIHKLFTHNKK